MPKPPLCPELARLEADAVETMLHGLKEFRPDLPYPQSHSDMQACVRALLTMFEMTRRPVAVPLRYACPDCEGRGEFMWRDDGGTCCRETCERCCGRGHITGPS